MEKDSATKLLIPLRVRKIENLVDSILDVKVFEQFLKYFTIQMKEMEGGRVQYWLLLY